MKPPKRITDPSFRYVSSGNTDIRKTFARERARLRKIAEAEQPIPIRKKFA